MDVFVSKLRETICAVGVSQECIYTSSKMELPGYYRSSKQWDVVVVIDDVLVAAIELKSHIGSFGNNANNRAEEAIGSAVDFWTAYRERAFLESPQPWLGYLVLLEDAPSSRHVVGNREPHFKVFPEFEDASYQKRYALLCERLVQERQYHAACLLISDREKMARRHNYLEPMEHLGAKRFITLLQSHIAASLPR